MLRKRTDITFKIALVLSSSLLTLILGEIAYRCKLGYFETEDLPRYMAASDSGYEYSREFGYLYNRQKGVATALISKGYPVICITGTDNVSEADRALETYKGAELKILVFGDSFTITRGYDERTWPDLLRDKLEAKLSKRVGIINLGHDGYGIFRMFDLAAAMVKVHKPDLAIIAFITDDLTRDRFWRYTKVINGEKRLFSTTDPSGQADPKKSIDMSILHPDVTLQWCESMRASRKTDDPLLRELNDRYKRIQGEYIRPINFFSMTTSFLFNRIIYNNGYHAFMLPRTNLNVPRSFISFAEDVRFVEEVATLKQIGIPYYLVHLLEYRDLKAKKYVQNTQQRQLLESLRLLTNKRELSLMTDNNDYADNPERLFLLPHDLHPSGEGIAFYARAVAKALIEKASLQASQ